jgi:hypothetical protein
MLWALCATACAGVLMIFLPAADVSGRLFGTGILTVFAILFMLGTAKAGHASTVRFETFAAYGVIVAAYLFGIAAIWSEMVAMTASVDDKLGLTAVITAVAGGMSVGFLHLRRKPWGIHAGNVGVGGSLVIGLLAFIWAWIGSRWAAGTDLGDHCIQTALTLVPATGLASVALIGSGTDRKWWRWVGVAACAIFMGLMTWGIWTKSTSDPTLAIHAIIVASMVAHANLCLSLTLTASQSWLRLLTISLGVCLGVFMLYLNEASGGFRNPADFDILPRAAAGFSLATGCATLALLILSRFTSTHTIGIAKSSRSYDGVNVECPRCGCKQKSPMGVSSCSGCRLILFIRVGEPRCAACDYNLLDMTADCCPECGAKVLGKHNAVWPRDLESGAEERPPAGA